MCGVVQQHQGLPCGVVSDVQCVLPSNWSWMCHACYRCSAVPRARLTPGASNSQWWCRVSGPVASGVAGVPRGAVGTGLLAYSTCTWEATVGNEDGCDASGRLHQVTMEGDLCSCWDNIQERARRGPMSLRNGLHASDAGWWTELAVWKGPQTKGQPNPHSVLSLPSQCFLFGRGGRHPQRGSCCRPLQRSLVVSFGIMGL
jgi:hypothetical protein